MSARLANVVFARVTGKSRIRILGRERDSSSISFSLTVIFCRDTRSASYMRAFVCFFLFPDENVMSEMEIAEWGPSRVLEARMEFGVLRNEAININ